uniref:Mediator of RNA polymerase II transcription subunit 11 n=1 Tax=Plectus sambesii TaxID=2011161 RepID=A0A914WWF7_9BILA
MSARPGTPGTSEVTRVAPTLKDRLEKLNQVEQDILKLLHGSHVYLSELSKEKQLTKTRMEDLVNGFKTTLSTVETEMSSQIEYLSNVCVGSAHEGSTFAGQEELCMAIQNADQMKNLLDELHKSQFPS